MISRLSISHFRSLGTTKPLQIHPSRYNLIVGTNGSGKTSVLEAIFLVSQGKSFRDHIAKNYINHQAERCTVFVQLSKNGHTDDLAISKDTQANTILRHNGQTLKSQAPITRHLPTLAIDPSATDLLDKGSETRRGLLDWLCFYGEKQFHTQWLGYQRLLKQRNKALKNLQKNPRDLDYQAINAWDDGLSTFAQHIHQIRQDIFDQWLKQFYQMVEMLLPQYATRLVVVYQAGFDTRQPLKTILAQRRDADILAGHTRLGAHRADLGIYLTLEQGKRLAADVLSRGEKRLLVVALKLSQLPLVCQHHTPIVLIDDVDAELDLSARTRLLGALNALPCQLFMTSLNPQLIAHLPATITQALSCFTIQQGNIST